MSLHDFIPRWGCDRVVCGTEWYRHWQIFCIFHVCRCIVGNRILSLSHTPVLGISWLLLLFVCSGHTSAFRLCMNSSCGFWSHQISNQAWPRSTLIRSLLARCVCVCVWERERERQGEWDSFSGVPARSIRKARLVLICLRRLELIAIYVIEASIPTIILFWVIV